MYSGPWGSARQFFFSSFHGLRLLDGEKQKRQRPFSSFSRQEVGEGVVKFARGLGGRPTKECLHGTSLLPLLGSEGGQRGPRLRVFFVGGKVGVVVYLLRPIPGQEKVPPAALSFLLFFRQRTQGDKCRFSLSKQGRSDGSGFLFSFLPCTRRIISLHPPSFFSPPLEGNDRSRAGELPSPPLPFSSSTRGRDTGRRQSTIPEDRMVEFDGLMPLVFFSRGQMTCGRGSGADSLFHDKIKRGPLRAGLSFLFLSPLPQEDDGGWLVPSSFASGRMVERRVEGIQSFLLFFLLALGSRIMVHGGRVLSSFEQKRCRAFSPSRAASGELIVPFLRC